MPFNFLFEFLLLRCQLGLCYPFSVICSPLSCGGEKSLSQDSSHVANSSIGLTAGGSLSHIDLKKPSGTHVDIIFGCEPSEDPVGYPHSPSSVVSLWSGTGGSLE